MDPLSGEMSLQPLEGGWSGETFLAEAAGERSVVRIFASDRHGPHAAEVQAALLELMRGLVPVPRVLELRRASAEAPALLVTAYVAGVRGDLLLPTLDDAGLRAVGERVGRLAATLAGMPQQRAGLFADGELRVEPFALDLTEWVADHEEALGWSEADRGGLRRVADEAQTLLDKVDRVSLVHSDLNPKNLLLDPDTLEIAALLDWEYAHAGHPFADLGNVLRLDREPAYVDAALAGYTDLRDGTATEALDLARAADLVALVDLAARREANPVAARAHDRLLAIARSGDLHST